MDGPGDGVDLLDGAGDGVDLLEAAVSECISVADTGYDAIVFIT